LDLEGRFLDCHSPNSALLSQSPERLVGRLMSEVMPPDVAAVGLSALQAAYAHGTSSGKQYELILPQGRCWFELSVARKEAELRIAREIGRAERTGQKMAVLFMDLDGFKGINDTLGHGAGDTILHTAADRFRLELRPADMVSRASPGGLEIAFTRLGGDEFTALILDLAVSLLKHADMAVYRAKRAGRDQACLYGALPAF
jgi:hypothetical protein